MISSAANSPKRKRLARDNPEQSDRFIEAAQKAGADESASGADEAFKKAVAKPLKKKD